MQPETSNTVSPAQQFIRFAAGLTSAPLPPAVLDQAKWCLLDGIGCGLFGATQPWSVIMAEEILAEMPRGQATLLGHKQTVAAPAAALCNGTALHGFELDDLIASAVVHPGCVIVPAVLAAAEACDASGERLLRGLIAGYEASARLSSALGMEPSHRGFHKTAVVGPVAAAIATGVVYGMSAEQISAAVGLACSTSAGIKSFAGGGGGGMVKRMHAGRSAESGVRVAQLARRGFTGPSTAIDGRYGLFDVFAGDTARPELLTQGLGEHWAVSEVWVKVFPICGWIQGTAQLLGAMRARETLNERSIRKVTVGTTKFAVTNNSNRNPIDTMDAQYSIPYCVGIAFTGDPADPSAFSPETISRGAWRQLSERVELYVDEKSEAVYPAQFGCRVQVHLNDGRVLEDSLLDAHGTPADPCSAEEKLAKFMRLAERVLPAARAGEFAAVAQKIDQARSVRDVMQLLRV